MVSAACNEYAPFQIIVRAGTGGLKWVNAVAGPLVSKRDPIIATDRMAASLSHVETRQVRNDYTLQFEGEFYQIEPQAIVSGLRGSNVRLEQRLDGALAVRYGEKYLPVTRCAPGEKKTPAVPAKPMGKRRQARRGSDWNQNFDLKKAPKVWQAAQESGCRQEQG